VNKQLVLHMLSGLLGVVLAWSLPPGARTGNSAEKKWISLRASSKALDATRGR